MKALKMDGRELVEEGKDGDAVHHGRFEEEALALQGGQVAEFAVGVDDCPFVGGDGVGSVFESGADVIDGGLAVLDIQRGGFEEDVGFGRIEPGADVGDDSDVDFRAGAPAPLSCESSKPSGFAFHPRRREAMPVMRNVIP